MQTDSKGSHYSNSLDIRYLLGAVHVAVAVRLDALNVNHCVWVHEMKA